MTAELLKILTKYPDYDIKGMMYDETFDWVIYIIYMLIIRKSVLS